MFKFVTARNPPNYIASQPGKVLSPSRGFKVALADAASVTATRTTLATSSATPSASASGGGTSTTGASSSPSSSPTSAPATNDSNGGSSTPVGAIVGGVVGGLAIVALAVVALLLLRMMKRKKAQQVNAPATPAYIPPEMGDTQHKTPAMYPTSPAPMYAHAPQELPGYQVPVEADGNYQGRLAK